MDILILDFLSMVVNWILIGIGCLIFGLFMLYWAYEMLRMFGFFPKKCYKCKSINLRFYTCPDKHESGFTCQDCDYDTGLVDDDIGC